MANNTSISINKQEQDRFIGDKSSLTNKKLHLSIEVREDTLFACLLDKDSNKYLGWAGYNRDTKRSLESILKEDILSFNYSNSSIVFTQNNAMLIPTAFFGQESVGDYLKQQNLIKSGEVPCSDFIKNNDCYSVYAVNSNDYSLLKQKYPQAVLRHHSSVFVEYLLALYKADNNNGVHVYVFNGYMDVVALKSGKLLLYNRYRFQTPNDFTYFLLWIYEELTLKPEDSPCDFFYGEILEKSEMFELTYKYLKNVRLAEKTGRFKFLPMLENIPPHRYYSLFMQYLCI